MLQVGVALFGPPPELQGGALMGSAYPRIIVLQSLPAGAAILLIVLHAIVDGASWAIAARARGRRAAVPRSSGRTPPGADRGDGRRVEPELPPAASPSGSPELTPPQARPR